MTTRHAIDDISETNAKLKAEVNHRSDIASKWLQRCRDAGLEFDDYADADELKHVEINQEQAEPQSQS